jgi:hypothetical protein
VVDEGDRAVGRIHRPNQAYILRNSQIAAAGEGNAPVAVFQQIHQFPKNPGKVGSVDFVNDEHAAAVPVGGPLAEVEETFRTVDVATALALSRGHASVLLGKLAGDGLERIGRGLYRHATASAAPREGSLPARILAWATRRGKPFGIGDVRRRFRLTDGHAGMLLSKLASGPHAIRRARRGLYEAH